MKHSFAHAFCPLLLSLLASSFAVAPGAFAGPPDGTEKTPVAASGGDGKQVVGGSTTQIRQVRQVQGGRTRLVERTEMEVEIRNYPEQDLERLRRLKRDHYTYLGWIVQRRAVLVAKACGKQYLEMLVRGVAHVTIDAIPGLSSLDRKLVEHHYEVDLSADRSRFAPVKYVIDQIREENECGKARGSYLAARAIRIEGKYERKDAKDEKRLNQLRDRADRQDARVSTRQTKAQSEINRTLAASGRFYSSETRVATNVDGESRTTTQYITRGGASVSDAGGFDAGTLSAAQIAQLPPDARSGGR